MASDLSARSTNTCPARRVQLAVAAITLAALAVRLVQLATPTLRWDEGWSLAHASLPWPDLWRVATEEWHPPLYVALLKLWIPLGTSRTLLRFPSVAAGVLAVPMTYRVTRLWCRNEVMAIVAAALMAVWPLHVYYSQVARMYALVVVPILGAAWCALRWEVQPSRATALGNGSAVSSSQAFGLAMGNGEAVSSSQAFGLAMGLAATSLVALWISYYAIWPLAVIWLYAAITHPRRLGALAGAAALVVVGYAPWLVAAATTLRVRLSAQGAGPGPLTDALRYLRPTLDGMLYSYGAPLHPGIIMLLTLGAGLALGPLDRRSVRALGLAMLAVTLTFAGVVLGAYLTRWFAPRYMVMAAPFLAMLLAWALVRIRRRSRLAAALVVLLLVVVYWPASTGSVYAKMLEVVDPIDPAADHAYLSTRAQLGDRVYFNVLARAGWYEHYRRPGDPPWSYAMRWDPIIEPMERIQARVDAESPAPCRLWLVLYKGAYGPNAPLKEWLDAAFYPAGEEWQEDTLIAAYVRPGDVWQDLPARVQFANGLTLEAARWTPAGEDAIAVELTWSGTATGAESLKVFVHLADETGHPLAQHDAPFVAASQRHGLFLSADRPGELDLIVGLYDGVTGERVPLEHGGDAVTLGRLPL